MWPVFRCVQPCDIGPRDKQPELAERLAVAAAVRDLAPRRRQELRVRRAHLPPRRVDRVVHRRGDVHVGQPRRVAVRVVGRDVIGDERALVGGERAPPGRRVLRDRAPVPGRVRGDGADGIDRGQLVEADDAVLDRIAVAADAGEERGVGGDERVDLRGLAALVGLDGRGGCSGCASRRCAAHEVVERRGDARGQLAQPESRRQERVHEREATVGVETRAVGGRQLADPVRDELLHRDRDPEDAPGVQALHQLEVAGAKRVGAERRLVGDQTVESDRRRDGRSNSSKLRFCVSSRRPSSISRR